jgi:hypothetical protein
MNNAKTCSLPLETGAVLNTPLIMNVLELQITSKYKPTDNESDVSIHSDEGDAPEAPTGEESVEYSPLYCILVHPHQYRRTINTDEFFAR